MAPAQPMPIVYHQPNTRASRELNLMIALRKERAHLLDSNPFVDNVTGELQGAFEALCLVDSAGATITDRGELQRRKVECVKAGLYGLRSILTAWLKYPAVGGRLEGAPIGTVDFMYTARSAATEKPVGQVAAQFARIMGDAVDPSQDDIEGAPHAQLRVNNCFLAIKKQFMALYPLLSPEQFSHYLFEEDVFGEDEAAPKTYRMSTSAALNPPSTAAQLMSASGLIAAAEDEEHDSQHIVVTGGVLKSKADKRADLAVQVAKAKKAESDAAARAKVVASASKATATAKGKSKTRRQAETPPVESEEDEEEDGEAVESPTKKAAAKKAAARKINGGKKDASSAEDEQGNEDEADTTEQPAKKLKINVRKRSAPVDSTAAADADADDSASKPAPKKRAKSTPATKKTATGSLPSQAGPSNISGEAGSVAPNIIKRGGAARKWLRDEDDLVKQMIVGHPTWPMPQVYREYSLQVANTPYQRHGQVLPGYRADFVEFPKDIIASDKERRKYDIAWRTYESVRQHTEKFKTNVSNANSSPPYTWDPAQDNVVAGQPKRAPPPRPAYFNNAARTPVPAVDRSNAVAASLPSAIGSSASGGHAQPVASASNRGSSGWNAVNRPAPIVDDTPEEAEDEAAPAAEESAEGDAGVESLEDFVAHQSAPPDKPQTLRERASARAPAATEFRRASFKTHTAEVR
jgi:hypothetical protein